MSYRSPDQRLGGHMPSRHLPHSPAAESSFVMPQLPPISIHLVAPVLLAGDPSSAKPLAGYKLKAAGQARSRSDLL